MKGQVGNVLYMTPYLVQFHCNGVLQVQGKHLLFSKCILQLLIIEVLHIASVFVLS